MTGSPSDQPVRGPVGMPAHLWELACSDVRPSVPQRVRSAVANGLNAPEGIRRIAARVAVTGAAMGVPAAMLGLGGFLDTADTPVDLAGGEAPLDGLDGVPATPGSYDAGGHGGHGGDVGPGADGFASATTHGTGDVQSGLGSTWHVQDPSTPGGDWLTVQMFQDVTVTETADGMFVVDAWQYVVIHDSHGQEHVFKEHYQVVVPDPPGEETDLQIHEHGFVHVVERPDGTFGVETDFGIDVHAVADGDGRDEVTIGQSQHVRYTDTDGHHDDDVTVALSEKATSTSDDTGDEATTTIGQDQVFDDGTRPPEPWAGGTRQTTTGDRDGTVVGDGRVPAREGGVRDERDDAGDRDGGPSGTGGHGTDGVDPSSPFGEEPADRGAGAPASTTSTTSPATTSPAASGTTSSAPAAPRPLDTPLVSATAATPAAAALGGDGGGSATALDGAALRGTGLEHTGLDGRGTAPELDAPPSGQEHAPSPDATAPDGTAHDGTAPDGSAPDGSAPDGSALDGSAPDGTAPGPFAGSTTPASPGPFEPPPGTAPGSTTTPPAGGPSTSAGGPSTPDAPGDNTPDAGHDSLDDPTAPHTVPVEPQHAEHGPGGHDTSGHDVTDHGTDGADHALVS